MGRRADKLEEHHLKPRVQMAALSKEAAFRHSNCTLLWE